MTPPEDRFLIAATAPRDEGHASGTIAEAESIRAVEPTVGDDLFGAAVLGDGGGVTRHLAADRSRATRKGGPHDWDPLTYLSFSRYLRLDRTRTEGFLQAARALLDAGASPNTGWWEANHQPKPEWESVIYGAAGVAHHPQLTRLLLERGADPNDGETPYHVPESYDNETLEVLVDSGKLTDDSLTMILLRKADWHDLDGIRYLLDRGVSPNRQTVFGKTAFDNALLRDNSLEIVEAFLDHGADPMVTGRAPEQSSRPSAGHTAASIAARRGRGDVLAAFDRRGVSFVLNGVDRLIAACARADAVAIADIVGAEPALVEELRNGAGTLLAQFAGTGNTDGVASLLDLGIPVTALFVAGDGYFGVAKNSTALHVAAWRGRHSTVELLIARGAPIDAVDGQGRTALELAVRACTDSYWSDRRAPDSIKALLDAGASIGRVTIPTGYPEADQLLSAAP